MEINFSCFTCGVLPAALLIRLEVRNRYYSSANLRNVLANSFELRTVSIRSTLRNLSERGARCT